MQRKFSEIGLWAAIAAIMGGSTRSKKGTENGPSGMRSGPFPGPEVIAGNNHVAPE